MLNRRGRFRSRKVSSCIEPLEGRVLMSFSAHINFQPANTTVPSGYFADTGAVYGFRSNGLTYGWNANQAPAAWKRNSARSRDQRYDTLIKLQAATDPNAVWKLAVPNGEYIVHVVAGDPSWIDDVYALNVQGQLAVSGTPTSNHHWFEGTVDVQVTTGQLVVSNGKGAFNNKINYIDIADPLTFQLQNALGVAQTQMKKTVAGIGNSANYPQYTNPNGTWSWVQATHWTSGFFPGSLWQLYQATGDPYFKTQATRFTLPLSAGQNLTSDNGFRIYDSFFPLLQQQPGNSNAINVMLKAAAAKSTQFNPIVGAFKAWRNSTSGNPQADFSVLMDLIMDSNLLFWAAKQTGNQTYFNEAVQNAITTQNFLVRADGGSAQFGYFNSKTGQFFGNEAYEGFSSTSTWSRGQAWGIYGFTMCAQQSGQSGFLDTARKMADYFIANLLADFVPYWDFNDPAIPNAVRDTSAAAVAASGLLRLSKLIAGSDPADAERYRTAAGEILGSLATKYLADPAKPGDGVLLHGALNVPANPSIKDNSLIFGDYYFLEAINEYVAG